MNSTYIQRDAVSLSLEKMSGNEFENFAKAFTRELDGASFMPTGGIHDGGADGYVQRTDDDASTSIFYQFSIEKDYKNKIRKTIDRIKESGRLIKKLIYVTQQNINKPDIEEDELEKYII